MKRKNKQVGANYHPDALPVLNLASLGDVAHDVRGVADEVRALTAALRNLRREAIGLTLNEPYNAFAPRLRARRK
jgi:hypothetical protein